MEAFTIRAIVKELREKCIPGRVQAVSQSDRREVVLTLRGRSSSHLLLSARPGLPSVHLARRRPRALPAPTAFCSLLRKHLTGLVLTEIQDPGLERAVHLFFGSSREGGTLFRLTAEIMGRWSNIILVEEESRRIVDALRRVYPVPGRDRAIAPGEVWRPPPSGGRAYLADVEEDEFHRLLRDSREENVPLYTKLVGLSPGLLALAEVRGGESLLASIRSVLREIDEGRTQPVFYPGSGRVLPLPLPGADVGSCMDFPSMNAAADHAFREELEEKERGGLLGQRRRELRKRGKKLKKKIGRIREEEKGGGEETSLRAAGQGLLTRLDTLPRGSASFELYDPLAPEAPPRVVDIDPSLSPRKNADLLFRKARKVRLRAAAARRRLPPLLAELAALEESINDLEDLSLEELKLLGKERVKISPPAAGKKQRRRSPAAVREYRGGKWRILVGKSSKGNDYITSRMSMPDDTWFHVRDYPGAHTVLKAAGHVTEPPPEVIQAAAEAAAYHSAARGEAMVDVAYTLRKHVRKVQGRPAGQVLVSKSRTVRVCPRVPEGFREIPGSVVK
jgi:predicted ribosome quality control (RQC) complex YloA/Tae2 family protein